MATATKPETPATSPKHPRFTITVPRSVLREALGKLLSVIPTAKVQVPISSCVLIEVPDTIEALIARSDDKAPRPERVQLSGTNFDATITLAMPVEATGLGRAALPAKRLLDFVASLPAAAQITITVDGTAAKLRSGRSVFALAGMDPSEFPILPEITAARGLTLEKGAFIDAVSRAVRLSSHEPSRPNLMTVRVAVEGTQLIAVATDGHSLGRFPAGVARADSLAGEAILPNGTVPSFGRLFADVADDATLDFAADEHRARLTAGDITIQFRLVAGPFPTYEQVIPRDSDTVHTVVCERAALIDALRRVALASDQTRRVECTVGPAAGTGAPELRLRSTSEGGGIADDVVAVERHDRTDGDETSTFTIAGNASKLVTALDCLTGERVTLTLTRPERPFKFYTTDRAPGDPTLTIVMPLRIV